jgi:hypothetical protein
LQAIDVRDGGEYVQAASEETEDSQAEEKFDLRFSLLDSLSEMPLAKQPYRLRTNDRTFEGITDAHGLTVALPTGISACDVTVEILGEGEING